MIFAVDKEDRTLYVFRDEVSAVAYCEGLDVEAAIWLFRDDFGQPMMPEFTVPSKRGLFIVRNGTYHLVPATHSHHAHLEEAREDIEHVEGSQELKTIQSVREHLTTASTRA